jgi:ABC-type multidrug transport system ATPase subunit
MDSAIRTRNLRKVYNTAPPAAAGRPETTGPRTKQKKEPKPQVTALDDINLDVPPGQIFGLLGPNGAGKSTTVGILTTRVRPTSGDAWIGNYNVWGDQAAAKRQIGVVAQRPNLDFALIQTRRSCGPTRAWILRGNDAAGVHCPRNDARSPGSVSR